MLKIKRMGLILSFLLLSLSGQTAEPGWVLVTKEVCNVRSKPDSSSKIVVKLEQYAPVKIGEKQGEYYEAETRDGKTGWAHESVVGTSPYASAKPGKVNWRVGPSKESERKFEVDQPDFNPLLILDRKGEYVQIQDFDKDQGWIHVSMLTTEPYCIVTKDVAEIRNSPADNQPVRFRAVKRVVLEVMTNKDGWLEVRHKDGNSGWIKADEVWGISRVTKMPATTKPVATKTATAASKPVKAAE